MEFCLSYIWWIMYHNEKLFVNLWITDWPKISVTIAYWHHSLPAKSCIKACHKAQLSFLICLSILKYDLILTVIYIRMFCFCKRYAFGCYFSVLISLLDRNFLFKHLYYHLLLLEVKNFLDFYIMLVVITLEGRKYWGKTNEQRRV